MRIATTGLFGVLILACFWACKEHPFTQGKALYTHNCANCHIEDGSGSRGITPPLVGSDFLKNHLADLPCLVRNGMKGVPVNKQIYELEMPANTTLTDVEIANLMNYLTNEWGAKEPFVKTETVAAALEKCK